MRQNPPIATVSLLALCVSLATPAMAQDAPATQQSTPAPTSSGTIDVDGSIVVRADRIRGQVDTAQPPIAVLDEADIASYGANSLSDLIDQLATETSSGRGRGGRPVFLVNGQRVSSFREMRNYPPEAVKKIEILPEEVALRFGYPADQRVINIILKDDFASRRAEAELGGPSAGGSTTAEGEVSLLKIKGPKRINLTGNVQRTSMLTEAERGVIQQDSSIPSVASDPDPADYRSLIAGSEQYKLEGTVTTGMGEGGLGGSFSINGSATRNISRSLSGLDTVLLTDPGGDTALRTLDADPLARRTGTTTLQLGSTFNKPLGDWQFSGTLDAGRTDVVTLIDRRRDTSALQAEALAGTLAIDGILPTVADAGQDRARSLTTSATAMATLRGNPVLLPAGEMGVTFSSGYSWTRIESSDTRNPLADARLTRGDLSGGVNIALPIASEREGFLGALGELSANLGGQVDNFSDFGTLGQWNAGLTWRLFEPLTLQASYFYREVPPGLSSLGAPQVQSFNVPVYDFTNSETVLATITTGGNPALAAETQRDIKLSASLELGLADRSSFDVEYYRNRSSDVTESFPLLTPAIEAAFPDRVTRDSSGTLVAIDRRPVTFDSTRSSRIRYGFNFFGRFGKKSSPSGGEGSRGGAGAPAGGPPPAGAAEGGPPPPGGAPGGAPGSASSGRFDPARFDELRKQFCATPDGQMPDLSALPERMRARLLGEDGKPDPAKIAAMKQRFCSSDGARPPGNFDPARFEALRKSLCAADKPGETPDLSALPEQVQARLKGEDGKVDPAKLAQLKQRICSMPAPAAGGQQSNQQGGGGSRAPMRFGPPRDGQGRWHLAFYHTIELENTALVAPGGPQLDLLHGDALSGNGVSRSKFQLEGGIFKSGIGMRLSGNYASATNVSDLHFGALGTLDFRMFVDLEHVSGTDRGFLKGARMSFRVNNVFNSRQKVTDANGLVPLSYQPALIDPVGRYVEVEFRKTF